MPLIVAPAGISELVKPKFVSASLVDVFPLLGNAAVAASDVLLPAARLGFVQVAVPPPLSVAVPAYFAEVLAASIFNIGKTKKASAKILAIKNGAQRFLFKCFSIEVIFLIF
jgi:hypothetical protein